MNEFIFRTTLPNLRGSGFITTSEEWNVESRFQTYEVEVQPLRFWVKLKLRKLDRVVDRSKSHVSKMKYKVRFSKINKINEVIIRKASTRVEMRVLALRIITRAV